MDLFNEEINISYIQIVFAGIVWSCKHMFWLCKRYVKREKMLHNIISSVTGNTCILHYLFHWTLIIFQTMY